MSSQSSGPALKSTMRKPAQGSGMILCLAALFCVGCGGAANSGGGSGGSTTPQVATPTIATAAQLAGAQLVTLSDPTSGATIYYTLDGTTPTTTSQTYEAPFLIASNATLNVVAMVLGDTNSATATHVFVPNIASGTLVWSDEFTNTTGANISPNSATWAYDTGASGWGNGELEDYCAAGSSTSPCSSSSPNVFVDTNGYLNIVAREPGTGVYTSGRMKTQGLFSFQYGRLEVRAQLPEAQGFWPAAWMMGNSIATTGWPGCGEMDIMERVNAAASPDWNDGSIHATGVTGSHLGTAYDFPTGVTASTWHTYGVFWRPGSVAYYVDTPTQPYVTYTKSSIAGFTGSVWPFDSNDNFIILNLAVGGAWPGSPNGTTPFPSSLLVDYVRLYTY